MLSSFNDSYIIISNVIIDEWYKEFKYGYWWIYIRNSSVITDESYVVDLVFFTNLILNFSVKEIKLKGCHKFNLSTYRSGIS